MPLIADKFGKASIDTDYAVATTVDATRLAGVTVLDAVDLSKFADDTPVFFITYQKTTDVLTGEVSVINQVSWKALVNAGANTLTNLTIQPGYVDGGNEIGDFIECIPTSAWENSLIDGIQTSLNPDGTLKTSAVQAALNIDTAVPPDYIALATVPSAISYLGQRSYQMTYAGIDYTDRLQPSTRWRGVRSNVAPIQCTNLNGTTQFWNKTSPNKLTFTDDFVVSAWVKLSSYADGAIISRYNGTNGWELLITSAGVVVLRGFNASSANFKGVASYQSLPLNKWVHITAQVDMSTATLTPTTNYIMLDGADVPANIQQSGTNPTALVQAGNLEVGSRNGGTLPFAGKIAQAAVFNAKVTQATMRSYISQGLLGTETSLASAYSFDGVATDLNTTTPNNLTANGSAVATNADSPFGIQANSISSTVEHAIITSVTKPASDTIITVQVPEGGAIPTIGGVSTSSYSSAGKPFGFPAASERWQLLVISRLDTGLSPAADTWYNTQVGGLLINIPIGSWDYGFSATHGGYKLGTTAADTFVTLSTANNTESDKELTAWHSAEGASSTIAMRVTAFRRKSATFAAATAQYLNLKTTKATMSDLRLYGLTGGAAVIFADNKLL